MNNRVVRISCVHNLKTEGNKLSCLRIESLPVKAKNHAHIFLSPTTDPSIHATLSSIFCHTELINNSKQNFALYNHVHHHAFGLQASPLISATAACLNANGKYCR